MERETEAYDWIYSKNKNDSGHDDVIIASFTNMYATRKDFYCMQGRNWVSNRMVSVWVAYLNEKQKRCDVGPKHYFFYSYFSDEIKKSPNDFNAEKCSRRFKTHFQLSEYTRWFISVLHNGHWFLYVMEPETRKFCALDSLDYSVEHIPGQEFMGNMITNMFSCLKFLGVKGLPEELHSWHCFRVLKLPRQKNSVDCGVFVILYMERWDGEKLTPNFTQEDIPSFRKRLPIQLVLAPENMTIQTS